MIVLDTCAIIWDALEPDRLSAAAAQAIREGEAQGTLFISDISLWEIAMLIGRGRLQVDLDAAEFLQLFIETRAVKVQPITPQIAALSASLDAEIGADPADRIITATTVLDNARLVTADRRLLTSDRVNTIW